MWWWLLWWWLLWCLPETPGFSLHPLQKSKCFSDEGLFAGFCHLVKLLPQPGAPHCIGADVDWLQHRADTTLAAGVVGLLGVDRLQHFRFDASLQTPLGALPWFCFVVRGLWLLVFWLWLCTWLKTCSSFDCPELSAPLCEDSCML